MSALRSARSRATPPRRSTRRVAALAVVAAASVLALTGCSAVSADNGPAAIVQRFVTASSVAGNGYVACTYLTSAEQRAMSPPGSGQGCRQALNVGGLVLGGRAIDSVHALHRLRVTQSIHGAHATVRLSDGRAGVDFHLVRVHDGELGEYRAPNSAWRISSGAQALEHPASPSAAGTALAVRFDTRAAR